LDIRSPSTKPFSLATDQYLALPICIEDRSHPRLSVLENPLCPIHFPPFAPKFPSRPLFFSMDRTFFPGCHRAQHCRVPPANGLRFPFFLKRLMTSCFGVPASFSWRPLLPLASMSLSSFPFFCLSELFPNLSFLFFTPRSRAPFEFWTGPFEEDSNSGFSPGFPQHKSEISSRCPSAQTFPFPFCVCSLFSFGPSCFCSSFY